MNFDKQDVINHISQVAGPQQAQQAAQQLPDQVDPDQHGNMLQQFGVDPQRMASQLGGQQSGGQMGGGGSGGGGYQDPGQGGGQGQGGQGGQQGYGGQGGQGGQQGGYGDDDEDTGYQR